jgi:hypothetical protein
MAHTLLPDSYQVKSSADMGTGLSVALGLGVWFALVFTLGASEVFVAPHGTPPLALLIAVTAPLILFMAGMRLSTWMRERVVAADLRIMMAMQAWRIGGFSFLALYTYGILPGYFAWPAGLGDIAVGVTAPWVLAALMRRHDFAASSSFVAWNVFGILDLVIAIGLGAVGPLFLADNILGSGPTGAMTRLPLVFVPAFFVPLLLILHLIALTQSRRFAGQRGT